LEKWLADSALSCRLTGRLARFWPILEGRVFQRWVFFGAALLTVLAGAPSSEAGGLYLSEFATSDMGAAGSGTLARGGDAGSGVSNPATMTRLDSHQLQMGLAPGIGDAQFDRDPDSPVAGGNGGQQGGLVPLMSTAYVHKVSDRFRAGLGLVSISGAALDPNNNWAGRNQLTDIQLFSLSATPMVAVRLTDWLSVGAGAFITYATLDWKMRVPLPGPGNREGKVKLDGIDDVDAAPLVGILLEPHEDLRIGLLYQGKTELKLSGDVRLPANLGPVDVKLELPLPHAYRGDAIWQVTDELALSVGGAFENWSDLEDTTLDLGSIESTVRLGFKDTWKLRGGIHYQLNDRWLLQTGISYDSSALRTRDRTPALPIDEQWRFGFGGRYKWTEHKTLGFSFQYLSLGNARINNAALKGDYENNDIYFFQMSLNFAKLPWAGKLSF
jgi:long-chain fatty acid transport protein